MKTLLFFLFEKIVAMAVCAAACFFGIFFWDLLSDPSEESEEEEKRKAREASIHAH